MDLFSQALQYRTEHPVALYIFAGLGTFYGIGLMPSDRNGDFFKGAVVLLFSVAVLLTGVLDSPFRLAR